MGGRDGRHGQCQSSAFADGNDFRKTESTLRTSLKRPSGLESKVRSFNGVSDGKNSNLFKIWRTFARNSQIILKIN
ncbi:hypothetical protein KIN20_036519 [Parelaphostrongylus tenuis]|uniref:Uncharacterized protein n=1 Tax=Parelaphostrongylus tenuis TaxID=148309 RepID=A0AAD5WKN4_PARTN|nr:hypothetical protein KIN20_036519 [Parelaphostrongylus tenuis]